MTTITSLVNCECILILSMTSKMHLFTSNSTFQHLKRRTYLLFSYSILFILDFVSLFHWEFSCMVRGSIIRPSIFFFFFIHILARKSFAYNDSIKSNINVNYMKSSIIQPKIVVDRAKNVRIELKHTLTRCMHSNI